MYCNGGNTYFHGWYLHRIYTQKFAVITYVLIFREHIDGATRALCCAYAASLAVVIVEFVSHARTEFNYCIVGTDSITIVTFETIST